MSIYQWAAVDLCLAVLAAPPQSLSPAGFGDQSSLDLAAQLRDGELTPAANSIRRELERRMLAALCGSFLAEKT